MSPVIRFGLIGLGLGLLLGSIYFSVKTQDLNLFSASIVELNQPIEEIDLSAPRDSKSVASSLSVSKPLATTCPVGKSATSSVYINEVAWMGSGSDAKAEWIELKNSGPEEINLAGWQLLDKTQNIKLFISGNILPGGLRIFKRGTDFTGTINNSDEILNLFNPKCELVDKVEATPAWPAGKSDGRTMERGSDSSWRTATLIGGTPNAENLSSNSTSTPTSTVSIPTSINTSTSSNSFGPPPPILGGTLPSIGNSKILISEVMVGNDTSGSYEFIELYNAGGDVNLSGWSIKKLSSGGKEYPLVSKEKLKDAILPAGKFLLLANEKGYIGQPISDVLWPGSYSLAYKENGINLYDPDGREVDELYWPEIPKNQSYNRVSWDSATFKLGSPTPQNSKQ
jgi:hypothetical protein